MDIGTGPGSVIGLSGIEAPAMHLRELSGPNCISHLELCQIVL